MKFSQRILAAVAAAAVSGALAASPSRGADTKSTPADQKSVSITIYNDNLGLVKDVRTVGLKTGTHSLWFEGVAALIDPTTVHIRSVDAPDGLAVIEQNFEYDLVSPDRLMQKYIGQTVELVATREDKDETTRARLIGTQGGTVYELENGKIAVNPPGRVVLPALPAGLISEPSLVWLLDSKQAKHTIEASYLTGGIGWRSDYVAVLSADDKQTDLSGWVTIDNQSGATYQNASLKLVAGDVHRAEPDHVRIDTMMEAPMSRAEAKQFREEACRRSTNTGSRAWTTSKSRRSASMFRSTTRRRTGWACRCRRASCASTRRTRPARSSSSARIASTTRPKTKRSGSRWATPSTWSLSGSRPTSKSSRAATCTARRTRWRCGTTRRKTSWCRSWSS
jgi:hypothetical protein